MTWFGIFLLLYWSFGVCSAFYVIGKGGIEATPLSAMITLGLLTFMIISLLFVGTGTGVL